MQRTLEFHGNRYFCMRKTAHMEAQVLLTRVFDAVGLPVADPAGGDLGARLQVLDL